MYRVEGILESRMGKRMEWKMKWKPGFFGGFIWGPIEKHFWGNKTLQKITLAAGSGL